MSATGAEGQTRPSAGRSRNMSAIRRIDTAPELLLRSRLHRAGLRFRKDYRLDVPSRRVRADVVFTRPRVAVFVDGCFWNVCPLHGSQPKTNTSYWGAKLRRNRERDGEVNTALVAAGWVVVLIWEHVSVTEAVAEVKHVLEHRDRPPTVGRLVVIG